MVERVGPAWDHSHSKRQLHSGEHDSPVRFDFCIVFKCQGKGQLTQNAELNIRKAIAAGLESRVFFSVQKDEIYLEIGCSLERLRVFAEQIGKRLPLDSTVAQQLAEAGSPRIAKIFINDDPKISPIKPYQYLYGRYRREAESRHLYVLAPGMTHPFTATIRLQLIWEILKAKTRNGGAEIGLEKMFIKQQIKAFYPKHEPAVKQDLKSRWVVAVQSPANAPLDDIRDYFGEKIALYFQFMAHLSKWMLPLAVLGLIVYAVTMGTHDIEHPIAIAFALFVCAFSSSVRTVSVHVRRRCSRCVVIMSAVVAVLMSDVGASEKRIAIEAGMGRYEEEEQDRVEFQGEVIRSPVDGRCVCTYSSTNIYCVVTVDLDSSDHCHVCAHARQADALYVIDTYA
eukprot:20395-Heterococcus_DN1.PRE.1